MKILIVEDDLRNIRELEQTVVSRFGAGEVQIVRSRDSAISALQRELFDLVILDRKIPTSDGALDDDVSHGDRVYEFIRNEVRGTPVRFWTAFPDDDYYSDLIDNMQKEDIWATGPKPTVGIIKKSRFDNINETLAEVQNALRAIDSIALSQRPGTRVDLSEPERRILKTFAKRLGGSGVEVSPLGGGFSDARVLTASVVDRGKPTHLTVAKITNIEELERELHRYQNFGRLQPGAAPAILCQIRTGAGSIGGTFYQLTAGYEDPLFKVLHQNPSNGGRLVAAVHACVKPWFVSAVHRSTTIAEIRRNLAADVIVAELQRLRPDLELTEFEQAQVDWNECCCHGDLHGENVLFDAGLNPILIDYGEAGPNHAAIDPITLELSAIFHPKGMLKTMGWPTSAHARLWFDLDQYLNECPYKSYVRACREWAYDVAHAERAMYVAAYTYLVRQVKYADTDKKIALALIEAVLAGYRGT